MARPKKDTPVDLSKPANLTIGQIERLTCPEGKSQAFLRDMTPGLRVRVTPTGIKTYVFEAKLDRQTIRRAIGDVRSWTIEQARAESRRLSVMLDNKIDPREIERQQAAEKAAAKAASIVKALTVGEVWAQYLEEKIKRREEVLKRRQEKPSTEKSKAKKNTFWGERHLADHIRLSQVGGVSKKNGQGVTVPGPLGELMHLPLEQLTPKNLEAWANREAQTRPTSARLSWRLLKAFLNWCAKHETYKTLVKSEASKNTDVDKELGEPGIKRDYLERKQLAAWFSAVRQQNTVTAAYLQVLLITGARPGEIRSLKWEDVDTKWRKLTIRDKVEGSRPTPLTPYVQHLLSALPRRNQWVFSSPISSNGCMAVPIGTHRAACKVAGIDGLTLHGLRRSFNSLTEWIEVPMGIVAQIQGHKPSATVEKHYKIRPLELLALHHERIEAWILEQAEISFDPAEQLKGLALVAA